MSKIVKRKKKQAGGTLLGLILGLIVGLAIAVVVAVMITKTPTPFTNKAAKGEKAPDVITTPEQLSDPNKPLYGKQSAVVPLVAPSTSAPVPEHPATPVAPEKTPDLIGQKIEEKLHETKAPIIDKSTSDKAKKATADTVNAKTDSADDKWIYYLQVGAFREQAEAENARAKLALQGFEARISERPSDNGSLYRVRIGAFNSLETMNRMRTKLSDSGINTAIVRSAK
ncbi:SPOR domain-containing protein [Glaciimonas sp. GG7]